MLELILNTKFTILPNEIVILIFEYLNIFEIFDSFDELNHRFNKLIRTISFHLNFKNIRKIKFDKFCRKILSDEEIQQQIYSLHLSNEDTCGQIKEFLSLGLLNEFQHLQSLTLTQIEAENIDTLKLILPCLSELQSFHLISPQTDDDEIVSSLPVSNLERLTLLTLRSFLKYIQQPTIITHLTIFHCSLEQLFYKLFQYVPLLKYLNVKYISKYNRSIETFNEKSDALHLQELIIGKFKYTFEDFSIFVKQIPNLKSLTITVDNDINIIDGIKWQHLITYALPYLKIFQFIFSCNIKYKDGAFDKRFLLFQNEFWHHQHQWYTEFVFDQNSICIYTIPYLSTTFKLDIYTKGFTNKLTDKTKTFNKVINLTLNHKRSIHRNSHRFFNVTSLTLVNPDEPSEDINDIECLKMSVNLSNLKHLDISMNSKVILSGELLLLLKESSQLSSMTINPTDLISLFNDKHLCDYLNKMIQKLNIYKYGRPSFQNRYEVNKFCQIFSNVEQLRCNINQVDGILILLNQLSKLSTMNICMSSSTDIEYFRSLFEEETHQLNFTFRIKGINLDSPQLSIWIDKFII